MSRTPTADDWQTLYREAILESDPAGGWNSTVPFISSTY